MIIQLSCRDVDIFLQRKPERQAYNFGLSTICALLHTTNSQSNILPRGAGDICHFGGHPSYSLQGPNYGTGKIVEFTVSE